MGIGERRWKYFADISRDFAYPLPASLPTAGVVMNKTEPPYMQYIMMKIKGRQKCKAVRGFLAVEE